MTKAKHPQAAPLIETPRPVASIHVFETKEDATTFRTVTGAGGWIFVCFDKGEATLCPPQMTARDVLMHPLFHGVCGVLIGQNGTEVRS